MINLQTLTTQLPFDISVEALANALLANSTELAGSGQILVRPLGHVNRASGREVVNISGSVFNTAGEELVYLDINRESLYDTLPEMLFIRQDEYYEDEVEKARHLARQEELARQFFTPFEENFYRTRIDLERAERLAIKELSTLLRHIFGLPEAKDDEQSREQMMALALVLPALNRVVGDLAVTSNLLTTLLRKEVKVTPGKNQPLAIPEVQQTKLGEGMLGVDLMLGDTFSDGIRTLSIAICNVAPEEVEEWLPYGKQRCLLEETILPYVLPAGERVEISINIDQPGTYFSLDDREEKALNILGYTTKIN